MPQAPILQGVDALPAKDSDALPCWLTVDGPRRAVRGCIRVSCYIFPGIIEDRPAGCAELHAPL